MCEEIADLNLRPDVVCADRGSKAVKAFMDRFPDVIVQHDDWHDLTKLDAYFKEHFKGIPNFDDKLVPLRYFCLIFL